MGLNAKNIPMAGGNKGPAQEPIDAGTYPARVVQVLDLGVQPQPDFKGQPKAPAHEIMLTYEFLDEFCKDENGEDDEEKPRWLSETFPLRNLEVELAKSTKRYYALDPDEALGGDFTLLVNTPCMVTVVQNPGKGKNAGKVFNNISGISAMRPKEAAKAEELKNPPKVFVLDEPDLSIFKSLPQWLQEKIQSNLNFKGSPLQKALEGAQDDDEEEAVPQAKAEKKKPARAPVEAQEDADGDEPW